MTGAGCWPTWRARSRTARVISDFRVIGDQGELFGPVASVPTCLADAGGDRRGRPGDGQRRRITAAVNAARRCAWARIEARHGGLPGIRIADKTLNGVTCIRLDATVVHGPLGQAGRRSELQGLRASSPLAGLLR